MKNRNSFILILFIIASAISSCKKKNNEDPTPAVPGSMLIKFEHTFNGTGLTLNSTDYYKLPNDDSLIVTTFKYYISNIQLKKTDGSIWKQPESYYIIDHANAESGICSLQIDNIPSGEYTDISYTIGVDSTRNVSGAQDGALDPLNELYWNWNSGYIFLKIEGIYKNINSGLFAYHIGGFKNSDGSNALQKRTFDFGVLPVKVNATAIPQVHFAVDISKLFSGPGTTIKVSETPTQMMPGTGSVNISKNYTEMFSLDHVHH